MARRAIVLVLDGVGCGAAPDAAAFGDAGADTLGHVAAAVGGLALPNLQALGLGGVGVIAGVPPVAAPTARVGRLAPRSAAKDSTTGHWELMGLLTETAPPVYPDGFPSEVMEPFAARTGRGWLCNAPASGTEVIERFGQEHRRSGALIVYTSADSVLQIAAHEEVVPVEELYRACEIARELLTGPHAVSRVIARPFVGRPGAFERTRRRRDLALPPHGPTVLDRLSEAGVPVEGVGKIGQLFAGRGLASDSPATSNRDGMLIVSDLNDQRSGRFLFANLIDFDTLHGHRNDPTGFAACLQELDALLGPLLAALRPEDLLILTADHGNDPTTAGTDHTREWVPLLIHRPGSRSSTLAPAPWIGELADVGRTVLDWLAPEAPTAGLAGTAVPLRVRS